MKKSKHANITVIKIRNIHTFDYDMHDIYTLGPSSNKEKTKISYSRELNL